MATPNHLHALHTIWACQAGKDVYVEKPVCHNVFEGRQRWCAPRRRHGRIVQAGTQSRSSHGITQGIAWAQAGNLGALEIARGTCFKPRKSIGKVKGPQPVPEHVNWDLYCGPAPKGDLMRRQLHYDWHWQFASGNGDLGNQGIHQVDQCRWASGHQKLAPAVASIGGRFGYDDDGDTPNSMFMLLAYDPVPILFEVRGLPRDAAAQAGQVERRRHGPLSRLRHRRDSRVRGRLVAHAQLQLGRGLRQGRQGDQAPGAARRTTSRTSSPRCARGTRSCSTRTSSRGTSRAACATWANISYLRGKQKAPDAIRAELGGHEVGVSRPSLRLAEHLDKNGVDLSKHQAGFGPWLEFDPDSERFTSDADANVLLTRDYRAPFTVTEEA